jgi:hypothetical protein
MSNTKYHAQALLNIKIEQDMTRLDQKWIRFKLLNLVTENIF